MAFSDHFVGVTQSRWTGYAILAAIIAVGLSVLFGKEQITIGQRALVVVLMFLMALPTIALVLFQINCLVSGTSKAPYCGWYAWIVAAITILYCILLIIVAVTGKAYEKKVEQVEKFAVSFEQANRIAGGIMSQMGISEPFVDTPASDEKKEKKEKKDTPNLPNTVATIVKENAKKITDSEEKNVTPFEDGPESKKKETFADYSYGAAPLDQSASMYML